MGVDSFFYFIVRDLVEDIIEKGRDSFFSSSSLSKEAMDIFWVIIWRIFEVLVFSTIFSKPKSLLMIFLRSSGDDRDIDEE